MIIGAAIYPYINKRISKKVIVISAGYSIGLYYFAFILTGSFIKSELAKYIIIAAVSFVVGTAISVLSSMCSVEFVKNVKEEFMARSSALFNAVCTAAIPVASFAVSALAGFTSTAVLFIICGIMDLIICTLLCSRRLFSGVEKEGNGDKCHEKDRDSAEGKHDGGGICTPVSMD